MGKLIPKLPLAEFHGITSGRERIGTVMDAEIKGGG